MSGAKGIARGYALPGSDFLEPTETQPYDVTDSVTPGVQASGAIVSTVDDLARFYNALFSGGLLPPELLRQMFRTVPTGSTPGSNQQGLGIYRYEQGKRDRQLQRLWGLEENYRT